MGAVTVAQAKPWSDGATQPQLDSFNIVTPALPLGFQKGNALAGNGASGPMRRGMFLNFTPLTGSWTCECIVRFDDLNPPAMEFNIQNIMTAWFLNGNTEKFEVRYFGPTFGPAMNLIAVGSAEIGSTAPNPVVVNTWYHLGLVYDSAGNTLKLFLNGAASPICQVTPVQATGWPSTGAVLSNVVLNAWPNDAGSPRDLVGAMDAFSISDTALGPGTFALPTSWPAGVNDWSMF